jgi:hypothetical protein
MKSSARTGTIATLTGLVALVSASLLLRAAEEIDANPSNYKSIVRRLKPGDTLRLSPGMYPGLSIAGVNGSDTDWITITGPSQGPPAIIIGRQDSNTVDLYRSSYVAIENLRIDSRGIPGTFGIAAHGKEENSVHHIRVEGNTFVGQGGGQQTDAISTKTPTWGWVIRYNKILGAGTGIYLGDSDGTQPFVAGLIENNLIQDTVGYNLEIKHQKFLPDTAGMPLGPTTTIIRNNVFIKNDRPSPDGDRPNVLVGAFPATGHGALNMYEIYGNVFAHNHREALFQASGRVTLHDNLFVDGPYAYPAIVFREHSGNPLKIAHVYHNTVYTSDDGIYFGSRAMLEDAVVGNLIFAHKPISGQIMRQGDNLTESAENAPRHVNAPSFNLNSMNFYPREGKCSGAAIDLSALAGDVDYSLDFNGRSKVAAGGAVIFRGAYAGAGSNPGWQIQAGIKPPPPPSPGGELALVWISPASIPAGRNTVLTLTGAGFSADANVTVGGTGVSLLKRVVTNPTQIAATLSVAAGSAGVGDVTVTQQSGRSNSLKLAITPMRR